MLALILMPVVVIRFLLTFSDSPLMRHFAGSIKSLYTCCVCRFFIPSVIKLFGFVCKNRFLPTFCAATAAAAAATIREGGSLGRVQLR